MVDKNNLVCGQNVDKLPFKVIHKKKRFYPKFSVDNFHFTVYPNDNNNFRGFSVVTLGKVFTAS